MLFRSQRGLDFYKNTLYFPGNRVPARTNLCAPPPRASHQTLRFPLFQRLRFICAYENQCFSIIIFLIFQNLIGSFILATFLSWYQRVIYVAIRQDDKNSAEIKFNNKFQLDFISFMLEPFSLATRMLQTIQRTCPNMLRFRALMSMKTYCT